MKNFIIFFYISLLIISCSNRGKDLRIALNNHKNEYGIEDIRTLIKEKRHNEALYQSASLGYSDIVSGLVKAGADINVKSLDGSTPLIALCREGNIKSAGILIENGADMNMTDNSGKKALDYLKNKKDILGIVTALSMRENNIVSEKFRNLSIETDDIDSLLNEVNKKVIAEMNNLLKKEYSDKPASKSKYEFNAMIEKIDARNFDFGNKTDFKSYLKKIGDNYYYIFSVGAPVRTSLQAKYLDSYTSLWLIKGSLSVSQFGKREAYFIGGFNGMPLTEDINIVSKGDYFTLEDYYYFGNSQYEFKYYTFKTENGIFYLDRISAIDNRQKESVLYRYDRKDSFRVKIDEVSYAFMSAFLGMNYY